MKDGLVEEFWDNGKLRKRYNLNKEEKKTRSRGRFLQKRSIEVQKKLHRRESRRSLGTVLQQR